MERSWRATQKCLWAMKKHHGGDCVLDVESLQHIVGMYDVIGDGQMHSAFYQSPTHIHLPRNSPSQIQNSLIHNQRAPSNNPPFVSYLSGNTSIVTNILQSSPLMTRSGKRHRTSVSLSRNSRESCRIPHLLTPIARSHSPISTVETTPSHPVLASSLPS